MFLQERRTPALVQNRPGRNFQSYQFFIIFTEVEFTIKYTRVSNFYKITSKKYLRALTWRKTTYTVSYLLVLESRVSQKVALNRLRPYWLSIFECFRTVFEQKCSFLWNLQTCNGHFRSKSTILKPMECYVCLKWSILQKKPFLQKNFQKLTKF